MVGRLLVAVALAATPAAGAAKAVSLAPGQAISISGTDIVCAFGGPANQIGIACLHATGGGTYTFRLDEQDLRVYRKGKEVGRWLQPKTLAQPKSPAVSSMKLVAKLARGGQFGAAGLDIVCQVDSMQGKPVAVCAKTASGAAVAKSYGVSLGPLGVVVARYGGGVVFRGTEGK